MKTLSFILLVLFLFLINLSVLAQIQEVMFNSDVAEVYKGSIEDAADYIASFPTDEEADQILNKLNSISEEFRKIFYGEISPDIERISEMTDYVLKVFHETDILQWNILQMYENQEISLLPGEGIKLTLHSYCLDLHASSPADDEFYYIDAIDDEQAKWLIPITDYDSKHPDEDLPTQALIWNMNNDVTYNDLPSDQQDLLSLAIPNAEKLYGRNIVEEEAKNVFDLFKQKAEEEAGDVVQSIEVIDDISELVEDLENRYSQLKLILPKYKTYQLPNGLLIRAESTGEYSSIKLTIVNPRSNDFGNNFYQDEKSRFASNQNNLKNLLSKTFFGDNFNNSVPLGKWKNRLKRLKGLSEKCENARHHLQEFNKAIDNPEGYIKGKAYDNGMDILRSLHKGNKAMQNVFDTFDDFNHGLNDGEDKSDNRPNRGGSKSFSPSKYRFKPGRGDVQPLKPVFGCE